MAIVDQRPTVEPGALPAARNRAFRSTRSMRFVPALALAGLTIGAAVWFAQTPSPVATQPPNDASLAADSSLPALAVEAESIYQFATLDEMVAASDLIVVGEVLETTRGRLVGDSTSGVLSRLATLQINEQLSGPSGPPVSGVVVEEEGWLPDGTPLIVSGASPSAAGDRGVWFLDRIETGDAETYVVINAQGRFLDVGGALRGSDQTDALVQDVQRLSLPQLAAAIRSISGR